MFESMYYGGSAQSGILFDVLFTPNNNNNNNNNNHTISAVQIVDMDIHTNSKQYEDVEIWALHHYSNSDHNRWGMYACGTVLGMGYGIPTPLSPSTNDNNNDDIIHNNDMDTFTAIPIPSHVNVTLYVTLVYPGGYLQYTNGNLFGKQYKDLFGTADVILYGNSTNTNANTQVGTLDMYVGQGVTYPYIHASSSSVATFVNRVYNGALYYTVQMQDELRVSYLSDTTNSITHNKSRTLQTSSELVCRPSDVPSQVPTGIASNIPTPLPSIRPTLQASMQPTLTPSVHPSMPPSTGPTGYPTPRSGIPSLVPTIISDSTSMLPTVILSSLVPSRRELPIEQPSNVPHLTHVHHPIISSIIPSMAPSMAPSTSMTMESTSSVGGGGSIAPTRQGILHSTIHPSLTQSIKVGAMFTSHPTTIKPSSSKVSPPSIDTSNSTTTNLPTNNIGSSNTTSNTSSSTVFEAQWSTSLLAGIIAASAGAAASVSISASTYPSDVIGVTMVSSSSPNNYITSNDSHTKSGDGKRSYNGKDLHNSSFVGTSKTTVVPNHDNIFSCNQNSTQEQGMMLMQSTSNSNVAVQPRSNQALSKNSDRYDHLNYERESGTTTTSMSALEGYSLLPQGITGRSIHKEDIDTPFNANDSTGTGTPAGGTHIGSYTGRYFASKASMVRLYHNGTILPDAASPTNDSVKKKRNTTVLDLYQDFVPVCVPDYIVPVRNSIIPFPDNDTTIIATPTGTASITVPDHTNDTVADADAEAEAKLVQDGKRFSKVVSSSCEVISCKILNWNVMEGQEVHEGDTLCVLLSTIRTTYQHTTAENATDETDEEEEEMEECMLTNHNTRTSSITQTRTHSITSPCHGILMSIVYEENTNIHIPIPHSTTMNAKNMNAIGKHRTLQQKVPRYVDTTLSNDVDSPEEGNNNDEAGEGIRNAAPSPTILALLVPSRNSYNIIAHYVKRKVHRYMHKKQQQHQSPQRISIRKCISALVHKGVLHTIHDDNQQQTRSKSTTPLKNEEDAAPMRDDSKHDHPVMGRSNTSAVAVHIHTGVTRSPRLSSDYDSYTLPSYNAAIDATAVSVYGNMESIIDDVSAVTMQTQIRYGMDPQHHTSISNSEDEEDKDDNNRMRHHHFSSPYRLGNANRKKEQQQNIKRRLKLWNTAANTTHISTNANDGNKNVEGALLRRMRVSNTSAGSSNKKKKATWEEKRVELREEFLRQLSSRRGLTSTKGENDEDDLESGKSGGYAVAG